MKCRYCGHEVRISGMMLISSFGHMCKTSPTEKHVIISDGMRCVYCGRETRTSGSMLITNHGQRCVLSPTGKHQLQ